MFECACVCVCVCVLLHACTWCVWARARSAYSHAYAVGTCTQEKRQIGFIRLSSFHGKLAEFYLTKQQTSTNLHHSQLTVRMITHLSSVLDYHHIMTCLIPPTVFSWFFTDIKTCHSGTDPSKLICSFVSVLSGFFYRDPQLIWTTRKNQGKINPANCVSGNNLKCTNYDGLALAAGF